MDVWMCIDIIHTDGPSVENVPYKEYSAMNKDIETIGRINLSRHLIAFHETSRHRIVGAFIDALLFFHPHLFCESNPDECHTVYIGYDRMDLPADPKIIDLLQKREEGSKPFVSIEFFPPRSDDGVKVRRRG